MEYHNALVKHNNNSISSITTPGSLAQGKMTLISEQTASGSASISFTSGIDSTYPIYKFEFINIHPATDSANFEVNFRDGGTNYDAVKTTTAFFAFHQASNGSTNLTYATASDLAQGTGFFKIMTTMGNDNQGSGVGSLHLFNPSSTTFVKHFMSDCNNWHSNDSNATVNWRTAGYCNTTTAIDGVQFKMDSGNIDSGTIKLYGIGD
jgi:hypothetical protein